MDKEFSRLRANPGKLYAYRFISEFFLIVPVLIPYYILNGLNATQIFTIQAAFHIAVLLLEVPTGYLADVIGRKKTLVLAAVFFPLGLALYAFTGSFLTFVLAECSVAVAHSMRSGSDSALMYDTLILLDRESEYKKFEGRSFLFTRVGTAAASIIGGFLALRSLHLPFYINVATYSLMLPVVLALTEPRRKKPQARNPFLDIVRISGQCFRHPRLRLLMLLGALLQSASVIGVWAYFLYFRSFRISVGVGGVLFALFQISSAFGSLRAHGLSRRLGEKWSFLVLLGVGAVFIGQGSVPAVPMIALIVPAALLWGYGWPVLLDAFNRLAASEIRATVLSVASMCCSAAFVVLSPLFGRVVDATSLSAALVGLGLFYIIGGGILIALLFKTKASYVIG